MNIAGRVGDDAVCTVLVDARPIGHPTARNRGIGRYVAGLLGGLCEIGAPVVALFGTDVEAAELAEALPPLTLAPLSRQTVRDYARPGTWFVATQLMLHPIPLDPIPSVISEARLPVAALMYDVIPYRFPERYHVNPNHRNLSTLRATMARTVDSMLAISQFAADTAAEELHYPIERIGVIGAGVEPRFVPGSIDRHPRPDRLLPSSVGGYVITVADTDERKNTHGLIRAWGHLPEGLRHTHHLVIVCAHTPDTLRRWTTWAAEEGVSERVIFTGVVDDDEMVALLQGSRLAVMPSFEEGFGLPVLEAAACGVPTICSDTSSLPEVLDEPAACFDPHDHLAIARAIERALTDDPHRRVLLAAAERAARRWTWRTAAASALDAIGQHGPRWRHSAPEPAQRIAVAGPFDGSSSGIGRYDESVLDAVRHASDRSENVVALVDTSGDTAPVISSANDQRWPVRAVGRFVKPWDFDHLVAVLGSSPHHVATVELATTEACHLWLHEASLVGAYVGLAHSSGSERWATDSVRSVIEATESAALASLIADDMLLDAKRLHELGVTMLGAVLGRSRSVIVSTERAADIVRHVRPDGPPLLVLPLAFPAVGPPSSAGPPPSMDIVVAGWLAANKAPLLAIEVLERLAATTEATLTFAGPALDGAVAAVRRAAEQRGVIDRVHFTGRLDDEQYRRRVGSARVGLQLRLGDRGEMSAAIADLVASGVPTVTNLATAGPSSPGLQVVESDVEAIVAAIEPLLTDDTRWLESSADALARAASWTFDDVARELLAWLAEVDALEPTTIRRARPRDESGR